ncbi:hypothetical protein M2L67_001717 [Staphylococcus pseudintermedius]|nr:terminase [Staphylococcus pseudintermedius]EJD5720881.1 hypothetical protein [Staphylococcus pseudintermedius]
MYLFKQSVTGDGTETKDVLVKKNIFECNPDTGRMNLIYNEHVELVEVPIKPRDYLKARDLLDKFHSLYTEKLDVNLVTTTFIEDIPLKEQ